MLRFTSPSPSLLLQNIKASINRKSIVTWSFDSEGDFTHTPDQWAYKAWLRPFITGSELSFHIIPPVGSPITKEIYAIYHGRFTEMMLAHFDEQFTFSSSTALAISPDIVRAA